jgi:hypothetical protein
MKHPDAEADADELAAHLEQCPDCAAKVRVARSVPVPEWARELEARRSGRRSLWSATVTRFVAAGLLAIVASLAVMAPALLPALEQGRLWSSPLFARVRGNPVVELWRERSGEHSLWSASDCQPGDRLELRVTPAGLHQLLVARATPRGWALEHTRPLRGYGVTALPVPGPVPPDGPPFRLAVLLGDGTLSVGDLGPANASPRKEPGKVALDLWVGCRGAP